ncbi:MAG: MaoC/PaaZ C-terminal domain-containing protein [Desulfomonilaceae bacterium]
MDKLYFEDYEIGETFVSPARTITETDIVLFSAFSGDWHPLHTDVVYAEKTHFKGRIAHGMLGLVVGSALATRLGPYAVLPKSFIAFYGMDSVRFTAPIMIGDTIHCEVKVTQLLVKDDTKGVITHENTIRNQRGDAVIIFVAKVLAGRKPKA